MDSNMGIAALVGLLLLAGGAYALRPAFAGAGTGYSSGAIVPPGWQGLTEGQIVKMNEIREKFWKGELSWEEMRQQMFEYRQSLSNGGPYYIDEDSDGICDHFPGGAGRGGFASPGFGPRWAR